VRAEFRLGVDGVFVCDELNGFEFSNHGFGSRLGNPSVDVTLRQTHSDVVLNAIGLADRECEGDALVSNQPGLAIGIRTADCVPILLLDSKTHAIAAIHAGWRGTAAQIARKAVERLRADFSSSPDNLFAAIGPSIRPCCYQVGAEVAGQFVLHFPEWTGDIDRRPLDLPEANSRQLIAAGVPETHIFDSGLCTACSTANLFSYRREPENPGRMIAAISRLY
jgi:YfiH family protein